VIALISLCQFSHDVATLRYLLVSGLDQLFNEDVFLSHKSSPSKAALLLRACRVVPAGGNNRLALIAYRLRNPPFDVPQAENSTMLYVPDCHRPICDGMAAYINSAI
jgi:hypothetical protein